MTILARWPARRRSYRVLLGAALPILWIVVANPGRAEPPARRIAPRVPVPDVRPAPPNLTQPVSESLSIIRNPFAYAPRQVPIPLPVPIAIAAPAETAPDNPPSVALALIGVATASLATGGVERTAIIAGPAGALYMVRDGDLVTARHRVDAVLPDGVVLVDGATGASLHLVLR